MAERVLVTGANGFVGRALTAALSTAGYRVRAAIRNPAVGDVLPAEVVVVGALEAGTAWAPLLAGVDVVIHLAARVHRMHESPLDAATAYQKVNVAATAELAQACVTAGVRRFIYLSSIKVLGEVSGDHPFSDASVPAPMGPYAGSKWQAEQSLQRIARGTALEIVTIRPPLVYGPGVKGNFLRLLQWVDQGMPLPFGACEARRSLLALDNLVDLLLRCTADPGVLAGTFLAADARSVSTPELVQCLAHALERPSRLVPIPLPLLRAGLRWMRQDRVFTRLCTALECDSGGIRARLNWTPPLTVEVALAKAAAAYRAGQPVQ